MLRLFRFAIVIGFAVAAVQSALAWNYGGHMVSGAFCYDVLKQEHPETLAKVVDILKQHPAYEKRWAKQISKADPSLHDQVLLMLAARWPDDVRGTEYDHPMWHYIDYGYIPPGQPDTVKVAEPPDPNILIGYRTNVETLKNADSTPAEKAIAVCWLMHLTGDIHQPLHATSLFTTDFPEKGDQGATKFMIRAKADGNPISLHRFWDDLILNSDNFQDVKNRAIEIRTAHPRDQLPELSKHVEPGDLQKWAAESLEQAKTAVYREGKLEGSTQREKAPLLPSDYAATTKPVAEHRMADAGYRMADMLNTILESAPAPSGVTNAPPTTPAAPTSPATEQMAPPASGPAPGEVPAPPPIEAPAPSPN